jgi:hypothetical protein
MLPRLHPVRKLDHLSVLVVAKYPAGLSTAHGHDDRLVAFGSSLHDPPGNAAWHVAFQISVHSITFIYRNIIICFTCIDIKYYSDDVNGVTFVDEQVSLEIQPIVVRSTPALPTSR